MKYHNRPYLELLVLVKDGESANFPNLTQRRFQTLCGIYSIDYHEMAEYINQGNGKNRELHIDLDEYYESKKENNMISEMNIGSEIVYVTPAMPRLQTMVVTRENIILAAQWCGATVIHIPSGPDRWSFDMDANDGNGLTVRVGEVVIREANGAFKVVGMDEFREKYDRV